MRQPTFGIIIPARYGSTRFPGKPLALIGGKPMILRTIEAALNCNPTAGVVVATDDERIAEVAQTLVQVVFTDSHLPSGTDRISAALSQLKWDCDVVVNLQGDEPFIAVEQVQSLVNAFTNPGVHIATLKKKMGPSDDIGNSNFVKVVSDAFGKALYFSRSVIPYNRGNTENNYFKHIGMYAFLPHVLEEITQIPESMLEKTEILEQLRWLENGYTIQTIETNFHSPAIDTPEDLIRAEEYLKTFLA
jgi:3-deoxy-manno-octulosonate cytidylyltransferase (CMP-KDO synthetase)